MREDLCLERGLAHLLARLFKRFVPCFVTPCGVEAWVPKVRDSLVHMQCEMPLRRGKVCLSQPEEARVAREEFLGQPIKQSISIFVMLYSCNTLII